MIEDNVHFVRVCNHDAYLVLSFLPGRMSRTQKVEGAIIELHTITTAFSSYIESRCFLWVACGRNTSCAHLNSGSSARNPAVSANASDARVGG